MWDTDSVSTLQSVNALSQLIARIRKNQSSTRSDALISNDKQHDH